MPAKLYFSGYNEYDGHPLNQIDYALAYSVHFAERFPTGSIETWIVKRDHYEAGLSFGRQIRRANGGPFFQQGS